MLAVRMSKDGWVSVPLHFAAAPTNDYTVTVKLEDIHGFRVTRTLNLQGASAAASLRCRSIGTALTRRADAVHLELVAADHEVGVDRRVVDAARVPLVGASISCGGRNHLGEAVADRDVRRRVLVEERVVEDEAGLPTADARSTSATSPRRAAPSSVATCVCIRLSPDSRAHLDRAAAFEADLEAVARSCPGSAAAASSAPCRRRAAHPGSVNTSSVGMFGTCRMPLDTMLAASQTPSGCRPIVRSVPGPR